MVHAVDLDRLDDDGGPPLVELTPATRAALDDAHRRDVAAQDAALQRERAAQAAARERELAAFLAEPEPLPEDDVAAQTPPDQHGRGGGSRTPGARGQGPRSSGQRARVARQRAAAAKDATRSWHGVDPPATPTAHADRWSAIQDRDRRRDAAEQRRMLRERDRDTDRPER